MLEADESASPFDINIALEFKLVPAIQMSFTRMVGGLGGKPARTVVIGPPTHTLQQLNVYSSAPVQYKVEDYTAGTGTLLLSCD